MPAKVPGASDDVTVGNLYTSGGNATWKLTLGADTAARSFTYSNLESRSSNNRNLAITSDSTATRNFTIENLTLRSGPDGTRSLVFGSTTNPVALTVSGIFHARGGELNAGNAAGNSISLNAVAVESGMTTIVAQPNAKITIAGGATLTRDKGALLRVAGSGSCVFTGGFNSAMTSGTGSDAIAIGLRGPGENFVASKTGAASSPTYAANNSWAAGKNITITSANTGWGTGPRTVNSLRLGASVSLDPSARLILASGGIIFATSGNALSGGSLTSGSGVNEVWIVSGFPQNSVDTSITDNGASVDLSLFSNPGDWKGSGAITLTAANTHTGTTRIGSGQLRIGHSLALQNSTFDSQANDLAVGSIAFASTITSATFGALTGAKNINLSNLDGSAVRLKVGNNGADTTYSGVLSGTGSLEKVGGGSMILTLPQNYTGGTRISAGTLVIKDSGVLPAESKIDVESGTALRVEPASKQWINSGTLRLHGNAKLTVNGTMLNQGVIDAITWKGTLPANMVNQGIVLDGSSVKIDSIEMNSQSVTLKVFCRAGHSYQLQIARGATLSGPWDNVASPVAGNDAVTAFTSEIGNSTAGFYRVIIDP